MPIGPANIWASAGLRCPGFDHSHNLTLTLAQPYTDIWPNFVTFIRLGATPHYRTDLGAVRDGLPTKLTLRPPAERRHGNAVLAAGLVERDVREHELPAKCAIGWDQTRA